MEEHDDHNTQESISKSFISDGKEVAETLVKYGKNRVLHCICKLEKKKYKPGDHLPIQISVENDTKKEVKSIRVSLHKTAVTKRRTDKKGKEKVTWGKSELIPDSDQEYFEGARFPLPPFTNWHGEIKYPLPGSLPDTSSDLEYELVFEFPTPSLLREHSPKAVIPVYIQNP